MTADECSAVFDRLDVTQKRLLLQDAFGNVQEVTVYSDSKLFRDVAQIIANYLDLKTWGHLRRTCHAFRNLNHIGLVTLCNLFMRGQEWSTRPVAEPLDQTVHATAVCQDKEKFDLWKLDVKERQKLCVMYFGACMRRFLYHVHNLTEECVANFKAKPPPLEYITLDDGREIAFPIATPKTFDLETALSDLSSFILTAKVAAVNGSNRWFQLPFTSERVHFPYGFIMSTSNNPHGNIFTNDWLGLVFINKWNRPDLKNFKDMDDAQKSHYQVQKEQFHTLVPTIKRKK